MGRSTQLDDLFQRPPEEFTAARNALAKTLTGDGAREVKALRKPNAVAWAVNQLYWKARPAWDALMKAGHALRAAQIGALKGRKSDVRETTLKHRKALTDAVTRARQIAGSARVNPDTDQLTRMLEALSLMPEPPDAAGRFVDIVHPSGFSALAGVQPVAPPPPSSREVAKQKKKHENDKLLRHAEARLEKATSALAETRDKADAAKRALNRAEADLADAEREVEAAEADVKRRSEEA
jgi:hypothetical protein